MRYDKKKLRRMVDVYGSITKFALAKGLHPSTLSKYLAGDRKHLSAITCRYLDHIYIGTVF